MKERRLSGREPKPGGLVSYEREAICRIPSRYRFWLLTSRSIVLVIREVDVRDIQGTSIAQTSCGYNADANANDDTGEQR
jgi:hypothetical protein